MKLILDTHAALWLLADDQRLGAEARRELSVETNRVLLSAAVVWEVSIKRAIGKLEVPDEYLSLLLGAGAEELPVRIEHALAVERLPAHLGDPFDRLLVAQALGEGAALVTGDAALRAYDVPVVW